MPAPFEDHFFNSADGRLNLYARDYSGEGPPLLLLHGLTRNSADFEPLAERLAGRYRLIVPDQRGRGRSQWDDVPANYLPLIYAADMIALLAELDVDNAVMIGTSMGGLIAMLMGVMHPVCVKAMVLNDVGPEVESSGIERIQSYVGKTDAVKSWDDAAAYCRATNGHAFPDWKDDTHWLDFAKRTFYEDPQGEISAFYDPAIASGLAAGDPNVTPPNLWPMWDMLAAIPVLAIRGAHSDILSAATLAEMGIHHPGGFTAVEIPGRGHAPLLDEPKAIEAIEAFLAAV